MLPLVQEFIKTGLTRINTHDSHILPPLIRLKICASFGPTFLPFEWNKRKEFVIAGKYQPTFGDKVRSNLAIIAAKKVIPLWREVLLEANILDRNLVDKNVPLREQPFEATKRTLEFPEYLLNLSEGILANKTDIAFAMDEISTAHMMLGNFMGFEQEEYPGQAYYANEAAFHALLESYGHLTYDINGERESPEATSLYIANPAGAAVIAYAGVFNDNIWTGKFEPQKSLEFWTWWLTEAIPEAWELSG